MPPFRLGKEIERKVREGEDISIAVAIGFASALVGILSGDTFVPERARACCVPQRQVSPDGMSSNKSSHGNSMHPSGIRPVEAGKEMG
jgi:hypothetical protein